MQIDGLPEIPNSWIIAILVIGLVVMRYFSIDSWTTAALGLLIGYITGQHVEAAKNANVQMVSTPATIPDPKDQTGG